MEQCSPNQWLPIALNPRKALRSLLDKKAYGSVLLLAALGGVSSSIRGVVDKPILGLSPLANVGLAVVVGPLGGIVVLYFSAWLLQVTGQWFNGKASAEKLRIALAWAWIPSILALLVWVIGIALSEIGALSGLVVSSFSMQIVSMALAWLFLIWQGLFTVSLVAEAQRFSCIRSIVNIIFAFLIAVVTVAVFTLVAVRVLGTI